ncbi:hypothetical protein ABPG74_011242 [Tetrahymena malaccensis]
MGNSESQNSNFQIQPYLRSGLTNEEIIMIKTVFDQQEPENGVIKSSRLRKLYQDSYDKKNYDQKIGDKQFLNFDEFFEIMASDILEKKEKYKDIQFDSQGQDIGCVFCPTAVDTRQQQNTY